MMTINEHNGFSNYDTWSLCLQVNNIKVNYFRYVREMRDYIKLTDDELLEVFKSFNYLDPINFKEVNVKDIRKMILNDIEEHD